MTTSLPEIIPLSISLKQSSSWQSLTGNGSKLVTGVIYFIYININIIFSQTTIFCDTESSSLFIIG